MIKPNNNPYIGFAKDRRQIRELWERFNSGLIQVEDVQDSYQRMLLAEWQRCTALGVDVAMNVGRCLTEEEFARRCEVGRLLLEKSKPVIDNVARYLVDVPGILILTESTGSILLVSGSLHVRDQAAQRSGIIEGSQWDENVAGSNGIGTAMAKRQPVHVFSSEHFCEGWHTWSCAAAPIFEPDGQTLIGIIDFTTIDRDYRDQGVGLTVSMANSINARIAMQRQLEKSRLLAALGEYRRRYPGDNVFALDHAGRPITLLPSDGAGETRGVGTTVDPADPGRVERIDVLDPDTRQRIGAIAVRHARQAASKGRDRAPNTARVMEGPEGIARFGDFLSADPDTKRLLSHVARIAAADVNVLIVGETGTGKELLAHHIHASSGRNTQRYVAVNCGAISKELLESTFFGYVRGAFSGADPKGRAGYFEAAEGGTLFLDEIGELPLSMQAALLRVLEDGSFQRVGSSETCKSNCRIIAATNRSLEGDVEKGAFRQDLYYRLKVIKFEISPLRNRPCDIIPLARFFVGMLTRKHGLQPLEIIPDTYAALTQYHWPGNVRELRNAMETCVLGAERVILPDCLPREIASYRSTLGVLEMAGVGSEPSSLVDHERLAIISALRKFRKVNWAAKELGIARSTLYKKLSGLGIDHAKYF